MATNWFVIHIEGADEGTVKLLPTSEAAQQYVTTRIAEGVPPDRLRLLNADDIPFGVTYQPMVTVGTDGPKTPMPGAAPGNGATSAASKEAAPAAAPANGATAAAPKEAAPAAVAEPAGTQDGVRLSSMFKTD